MKNMYNMKLNERILINSDTIWEIIRVPGGWIYQIKTGSGVVPCYIPYNNEFMELNND